MNPPPKNIFISYSKHDIQHKETLLKHLSGLKGSIITWDDRNIRAGEEWDTRIKEELHKADVVLYLVTAHSIATDYIQTQELPLIEKRCQKGECILVPIIVNFCQWQKKDFAKYQTLPQKGIEIANTKHWVNEDEAWTSVVVGIEEIVQCFKPAAPAAQQRYLNNYADDLVIHAAADDSNFAEAFKIELQKHLAAKLGGFKFRLRLQTHQDDFSNAATAIILLSDNYLQQYGDKFQTLTQLKEKRLLLVRVNKTDKPQSLDEVVEYDFFHKTKQNSFTYPTTDMAYQQTLAELVDELDSFLQQLKSQQKTQEEIQRLVRQTPGLDQNNQATVFINVAPEDRSLGKQIQTQLTTQYRVASALPASTETRTDISNKYLLCHAVLLIYVGASEQWIDAQLLACGQAASEHQKDFKIIAIHSDARQIQRINVSLPQLTIEEYYCPPESIDDYLPRFVEALK